MVVLSALGRGAPAQVFAPIESYSVFVLSMLRGGRLLTPLWDNVMCPLQTLLPPIRIGWEVLARSGADESCTPACFRTRSIWPQPDSVRRNQIGSGLVLLSTMQAVCGITQPSLKVGNWWQAGCVLLEPGLMILAHRLASRPDAFYLFLFHLFCFEGSADLDKMKRNFQNSW